jgi:cytochrome d ubiquinol oxidase subunit II
MTFDLTLIWAIILATAVFLYVVMDGFDLGVGILFPFIRTKSERDTMVNTIAPFWDGNETWLVLGGGGLLAVFPIAYAIIMPALYMPVIIMLLALVFRGVSFEMRFKARSTRGQRLWDSAFSWGSYGAAFCQGIMLGALVQGIKVKSQAYAGAWWDWLSPFSVFTGIAVVLGYGLLGACWLIWKTEGPLQKQALHTALRLGALTLLCIALVSAIMPLLSPTFRDRWFTLPNLFYAAPVPLLVVLLAWRFFVTLSRLEKDKTAPISHEKRRMWTDSAPFLYALGLFFLSYAGLCISMWPMIVPPHITLHEAAASPSSQRFLLVGALILVPTILTYTAYVYWIFRGKISTETGYH